MKQAVDIRIHSLCESQEIVQRVEGEVFLKAETVYLKYREPDPEMGLTQTMLKLRPGRCKIIRHGDVRSEQEFVLNRKASGFYCMAQGKLELETYTHAMTLELDQGLGSVFWSYDLAIMGEAAGRYSLRLDIRPRGEAAPK